MHLLEFGILPQIELVCLCSFLSRLSADVKFLPYAYNESGRQTFQETLERSVALWHVIHKIAAEKPLQLLRKTTAAIAAVLFCARSSTVKATAPAVMKTAAAVNIPVPAATRSGRSLLIRADSAAQTYTMAVTAAV